MNKNPGDIVIVQGVRTPIGKFGGGLAGVAVADLGSLVLAEVLRRSGVAPQSVDEVILGNVLQAGQGQGIGRQAAMRAGLPDSVPAMTINNICGSGLKAVNLAAALIRAGDAEVVLAGGIENMSASGFVLNQARWGYRINNGQLIDSMVNDALTDASRGYHMGVTAENIAEKLGISRQAQDEFAAASQQKAEAAMKAGRFRDEIVPVEVVVTKKEKKLVMEDEQPRSGTTTAALASLKPAFKEGGTVTAGNASGINDGAAAVLVMSAEKAAILGAKPMARIVAGASAGVDPAYMGLGPVESTRKVMKMAGLKISDFDLIEANEAFAAQALGVAHGLQWDDSRVNVNGGAIALGHPVGASGARILVTLLHELKRRDGRYGLATLCVGGGMGVSLVIERV